jgi:hypothetical protein
MGGKRTFPYSPSDSLAPIYLLTKTIKLFALLQIIYCSARQISRIFHLPLRRLTLDAWFPPCTDALFENDPIDKNPGGRLSVFALYYLE